MLKHISFFHGHRGSVLALADAESGSFFSSGAEGLIVKWNLANPDDGQVLQKLPGYAASLAFDNSENLLYSGLNHIGVYVLEADRGKIKAKIDLPLVAFKSVDIVDNYLIITSLKGELLLMDKHTYKILKRINTGLDINTSFAIDAKNQLWYNTIKGLRIINLSTLEEKQTEFESEIITNSIGIYNDRLITLSNNKIEARNLSRRNSIISFTNPKVDFFNNLIIKKEEPEFLALSNTNTIVQFQLSKNNIKLIMEAQNAHNGGINQLLWIESYKFVVTAGADKKIGIWDYN